MLMLGFHFIWIQILALFAAGLLMLHFYAKTMSNPLRIGGWTLIGAAVLSAVCVLYYAARYLDQGAFDSAHPMAMRDMKEMMHMKEMMQSMGKKGSPKDHESPAGAKDEHDH